MDGRRSKRRPMPKKLQRSPLTNQQWISLEKAKQWLKVDTDDDDDLLQDLIMQVGDLTCEYLGRSILPTQVVLTSSNGYSVQLPYGPVDTIVSVQDDSGHDLNYDWDGTWITVPTPYSAQVVITYNTADELPHGLVMAMLEVLTKVYEQRGEDPWHYLIYENQNLSPYRMKLWV